LAAQYAFTQAQAFEHINGLKKMAKLSPVERYYSKFKPLKKLVKKKKNKEQL
jgi:hypothetical protein